MNSLFKSIGEAIGYYLSPYTDDSIRDSDSEEDVIFHYRLPVIVEKVEEQDKKIQSLQEKDVDILNDIKQYTPFNRPLPKRVYSGLMWSEQEGAYVYLNEENRAKQVLTRLNELNNVDESNNECVKSLQLTSDESEMITSIKNDDGIIENRRKSAPFQENTWHSVPSKL